ncbi:helix-turn-helix domain-containing protein [Alkalimarinus coralli]|uniref:helix-turn-helix domain-containing protein n=1 Tax=Alkalimarinus coralli TaxID=2935863 RepID=UPI00202B5D4D|nr:AraC family transcriptional regulator [Alkalimarinus coralli]
MAEYQHIFGCEVLFEQKANRIIFSYETLLLASNAPNKGLYEHLLKQVDSIYQADISQKRYRYKVSEYLRSEKEWQHWPSLDETANALGVSVSTLKRRLKQEGSSYQEISDRIRYQRAQRMFCSPKHTVSEVAYRLGFSCSASFGHSFKRWSGMSPTEYTN